MPYCNVKGRLSGEAPCCHPNQVINVDSFQIAAASLQPMPGNGPRVPCECIKAFNVWSPPGQMTVANPGEMGT